MFLDYTLDLSSVIIHFQSVIGSAEDVSVVENQRWTGCYSVAGWKFEDTPHYGGNLKCGQGTGTQRPVSKVHHNVHQ